MLSTQSSDTSQVTGAEQVLGCEAQITSFQFLLKWVVVVACCIGGVMMVVVWCGGNGGGVKQSKITDKSLTQEPPLTRPECMQLLLLLLII